MNRIFEILTLCLIVECYVTCTPRGTVFNEWMCYLMPDFSPELRQQIRSISSDAQKIIDFVVNGNDKGVTYRELSYFVDRFGSRLTGTRNLEDAIDYMVKLLNTEGHDKVYTEKANVPRWVRIDKPHS